MQRRGGLGFERSFRTGLEGSLYVDRSNVSNKDVEPLFLDVLEDIEGDISLWQKLAVIGRFMGKRHGNQILTPFSLAVYSNPIWIRLYNLLIEYWGDSCLEKIGHSLGTLLDVDEQIIEGDSYLYIRLKLATVKKVPSKLLLQSADYKLLQDVEVEEVVRDVVILTTLQIGEEFSCIGHLGVEVAECKNNGGRKKKL
ncbi:hypothetical protein SUGI_0463740 [Cryptomeria japonica]|nr:hypothetical protein SUGI_0463740 [Cryptomeria japonica]